MKQYQGLLLNDIQVNYQNLYSSTYITRFLEQDRQLYFYLLNNKLFVICRILCALQLLELIEIRIIIMILEQNYENIAIQTSKAFRIYAKRMFSQALLNVIQKRKIFIQQKFQQIDSLKQSDPKISITSYVEIIKQETEKSSENIQKLKKKKTFLNKSIVFNEQQINYNQQQKTKIAVISQVYYGDCVYIIQSNSPYCQDKLIIYFEMNKLKGYQSKEMRSLNNNCSKCLFQICLPDQEFGYVKSKQKIPLKYGQMVCFKNIFTNKYLTMSTNKICKKVYGMELMLTSDLSNMSMFLVNKMDQQYIKTNKYVYTYSSINISLYFNQFYKIALLKERGFRSEQFGEYCFIGNSKGSTFQFIKPKISAKNQFSTGKYYLIKCGNKFLAANQKKLNNILKQNTMVLHLDNNIKSSVSVNCIEQNKNYSSQLKIYQNKNLQESKISLSCIWELHKIALLDDLTIGLGQQIMIYNLCAQQYITYNKTSKKMKISSDPAEMRLFQIKKFIEHSNTVFRIQLAEYGQLILKNQSQSKMNYVNINQKNKSETSNNFFEILEIDKSQISEVLKFSQIYNVLIDIYKFIGNWALVKQTKEQKTEIHYKYNKAIQQEYILKGELQNIDDILKELEIYLRNDGIKSSIIENSQNIIKQLKIFELLIQYCKLIITKIEYPKSLKTQNISFQHTAFFIAKRNLQIYLLKILDVLNLIIHNNKQCSNVLIQHSAFFNLILKHYPEKVGYLLQQAIKNLSILNSKKSNQEQQLFQWVKLIERVSQNNIKTQIIYLQIIAEIVVDPLDNGITTYQNKYKDLLFKQKNGIKYKNLMCQFQIINNIPQITFINQNNHNFKKQNPLINQGLVKQTAGYITYSLQALSSLAKINNITESYICYINRIIRILRNLCRGRNKKSIKTVQDLGISNQYIILLIKNQNISIDLRIVFLSLYAELYIDQDPFIGFNKIESKCISCRQLNHYNLQLKTSLIFKQYTEQIEIDKLLREFDEYIIPFVKNYLIEMEIKCRKQAIQNQKQLIYLLKIIKLINKSVYLGYMNIIQIKDSIQNFIVIIDFIIQKNKSTIFIEGCFAEIIYTFLKLLQLYHNILKHLVTIQFVLFIHSAKIQYAYAFDKTQIQEKCKTLLNSCLNIFLLQPNIKHKAMNTSLKYKFGQIRNEYSSSKSQQKKTLKTLVPSEILHNACVSNDFSKLEEKITQFLLKLLLLQYKDKKELCVKQIINLITRKGKIEEEISNHLDEIQLLVTTQQEQIYEELNGKKITQILNMIKLQSQISKLVDESTIQTDDKVKNEIVLETNNLLKKLIKKLKQYRSKDIFLYKKAQNILQKMKLYDNMIKIILFSSSQADKNLTSNSVNSSNNLPIYQVLLSLIQTIFKFIILFIYDNQINIQLLIHDYQYFLEYLDFKEVEILFILIFPYFSTTKKLQCFNIIWNILKNKFTNYNSNTHISSYNLSNTSNCPVNSSNNKVNILKILYNTLDLAQKFKPEQAKKFYQIAIEKIRNEQYLKQYLDNIESNNKNSVTNQQFIFLNIVNILLERNPSFKRILVKKYQRVELQNRIRMYQYKNKEIYLRLYYLLYIKNQLLKQKELNFIIEKIVALQIYNFKYFLEGLIFILTTTTNTYINVNSILSVQLNPLFINQQQQQHQNHREKSKREQLREQYKLVIDELKNQINFNNLDSIKNKNILLIDKGIFIKNNSQITTNQDERSYRYWQYIFSAGNFNLLEFFQLMLQQQNLSLLLINHNSQQNPNNQNTQILKQIIMIKNSLKTIFEFLSRFIQKTRININQSYPMLSLFLEKLRYLIIIIETKTHQSSKIDFDNRKEYLKDFFNELCSIIQMNQIPIYEVMNSLNVSNQEIIKYVSGELKYQLQKQESIENNERSKKLDKLGFLMKMKNLKVMINKYNMSSYNKNLDFWKIENLDFFYEIFNINQQNYFLLEFVNKIIESLELRKNKILNKAFQQKFDITKNDRKSLNKDQILNFEQSKMTFKRDTINTNQTNSHSKILQYNQDKYLEERILNCFKQQIKVVISEKYQGYKVPIICNQFNKIIQAKNYSREEDNSKNNVSNGKQLNYLIKIYLYNKKPQLIEQLILVYLKSKTQHQLYQQIHNEFLFQVIRSIQQKSIHPTLLLILKQILSKLNVCYNNVILRKIQQFFDVNQMVKLVFQQCRWHLMQNLDLHKVQSLFCNIIIFMTLFEQQKSILLKQKGQVFLENFYSQIIEYLVFIIQKIDICRNQQIYKCIQMCLQYISKKNKIAKLIQHKKFYVIFNKKIQQNLIKDQNKSLDISINFYSIKQRNKIVLKYLEMYIELIIQLKIKNMISELFNILVTLDIKFFIKILQQNYQLNIKSRQSEIEKESECKKKQYCTQEICNQYRITSYDKFIFDVLCKIMILVEIMHGFYVYNINGYKQVIAKDNHIYLKLISKIKQNLYDPEDVNKNHFTALQNKLSKALQFYIKFKGKILIISPDSNAIRQIYFKIPFLSSYLNHQIQKETTQIIQSYSRQDLYMNIYKISRFLYHELQRYKLYDQYSLLNFLIRYRCKIQMIISLIIYIFNFVIIVIQVQKYSNPNVYIVRCIIIFIGIIKILYFIIDNFTLVNKIHFLSHANDQRTYLLKQIIKYQYVLKFINICICFVAWWFLHWYAFIAILQSMKFKIIQKLICSTFQRISIFIKLLMYGLLFLIITTFYFRVKFINSDTIEIFKQVFIEVVNSIINQQNVQQNYLFYIDSNSIFLYFVFDLIATAFIALILANLIYQFHIVRHKKNELKQSCLICLKTKKLIEQSTPYSIEKHKQQQHNIWNYLYYFIYIEKKTLNKDDHDEKYIRKCIEQNDWECLKLR